MLDKQNNADKPVKEQAKENREDMKRKSEDEVTVSSDDSFPASDPPSFNPGVTGAPKANKH